ncbi:autoinducer binding domain-containing protein [Primorskyibacter sp. S187A]|uniref:helix-turn-helix transcriptional regulator n=1 Tax=Primorskyibacter sp. S187A TaxID=3415130 RepID=UPI003C7B5F2B
MEIGFSETLMEEITDLAPAGFRMVRHAAIFDPVIDFVDGMSEEWADIYLKRGYAISDPVFLWSILNTGAIRWNEVRKNDFNDILEKAKAYEMNYGAVASQVVNGRFSILSISRQDRDYTDSEVARCAELLESAIMERQPEAVLKPAEQVILQALARGESLQQLAEDSESPISTIKTRLKRARLALNAKTATQAVAEATRRNLL